MRKTLVLLASLTSFSLDAAPALGQTPTFDDPPKPYVSTRPVTRKEWSRRESLKHYVLGLLCEHEDRLVEALKAFEEAARLDPEAAAVFKAQIPLLMGLDRRADALAAAQKVVALDPDDYHTWFLVGRIHKLSGHLTEARKALASGVKAPSLGEHPELAQEMYHELGALHEAAGELTEAVAAFTAAASILDHPDLILEHGPFKRESILARAAETYERIGHLQRKLKNFDQAAAAYKKAQERMPERAGRLNFNLAQLRQEQGQFDQALVFVDAYLRLQPLGVEAYQMKIELLEKLKQTAAIVPWLERAAEADPNNANLRNLLAREYTRAGQFVAAEKLYKKLAEQNPGPDIYRGMFQLYKNDPARGSVAALRLLDSTLNAVKNSEGPPGTEAQQAKAMLEALREDKGLARDFIDAGLHEAARAKALTFETLHLLAVLADKLRHNEAAEKFYRAALKQVPATAETLVYGGLLRTLWKLDRPQDIIALCDQGLKETKATNRILFLNDKAKALARLAQYPEALRVAQETVAAAGASDKLAVRMTYVRILTIAEKYAQAEAECQRLLKEHSQPGEVLEIRYLLSNVYSAEKKLAQAEEQLELILKVDPNNITVNNDLGYLWADQNKNLDKAEAMIRRAIELERQQRKLLRVSGEEDRDHAAYIDSLGWVLFRQGKIEEARKELELAVSLPEGDDPVLWDHLGDVYHRLQLFKEARRAWQHSLHLYEHQRRRKLDERYHEVQRKLKLTERAGQ